MNCKKCNAPVDEKQDESIFYCDNCLLDVALAFKEIQIMLDDDLMENGLRR